MKSKYREAIDAVEEYLYGYYVPTLEAEQKERITKTILSALTIADEMRWRDISEWHEDFGDCLFMFFREGEFYAIEFTSPLATTFDEEYTANCDHIVFKEVCTKYELPQPPKTMNDE